MWSSPVPGLIALAAETPTAKRRASGGVMPRLMATAKEPVKESPQPTVLTVFMGGGVAMEPDGTERPLTMDEYVEDLSGSPAEMLEVSEDGRVMLYWYDQAVDLTDRFEDGVCRLTLTHGDETMYFTVTDAGDGAYSVSAGSDGYVD